MMKRSTKPAAKDPKTISRSNSAETASSPTSSTITPRTAIWEFVSALRETKPVSAVPRSQSRRGTTAASTAMMAKAARMTTVTHVLRVDITKAIAMIGQISPQVP